MRSLLSAARRARALSVFLVAAMWQAGALAQPTVLPEIQVISHTWQAPRWMAYANYGFTDATYQFTGTIALPNNPMADADGNIFVTPGNKIPAIPAHQIKFGGEYAVTPEWKVGTDVAVVGSQYFVGDDSNLNAKVPAYWVANLRSSYQLTKELQVFAIVTNLFNQKYYTYGTYFELRRRRAGDLDRLHRSAHRHTGAAARHLWRVQGETVDRQRESHPRSCGNAERQG